MSLIKFSSEAGPRQTKQVSEALSAFTWKAKSYKEITDSFPDGYVLTSPMSPVPEAAAETYNAIAAKYDAKITRENYRAIIADIEAATAALVLPVRDNRTTAEERAERARVLAESEAKRKTEAEAAAIEKAAAVDRLRKLYPWAVGGDRFKTGAARAAANLKKELQATFPGVKFSVKSDTFSMGDSVDVTWEMGPSYDAVNDILSKYKDGHFDGMQDMHEYDNSAYGRAVDEVLGRAKYVHGSREATAAKHKIAPDVLREYGKEYTGSLDVQLSDHGNWNDLQRVLSDIVSKYCFPAGVTAEDIRGAKCVNGIWSIDYDFTPEAIAATSPATSTAAAAAAVPGVGGFDVQKHYHEKRGKDFWLVVPRERLEYDVYKQVLTAAESAGGWQSRKWGRCPSGFGFATEAAAVAFVDSQTGSSSEPATSQPQAEAIAATAAPAVPAVAVAPGASLAAKFRELADNMQSDIENDLRPLSQNWTPKRGREHASRVFRGEQKARAQKALRVLADHWEAGTVPPVLRPMTTKNVIMELVAHKADRNHSTDCIFDSGELAHPHNPAAVALRQLVENVKTDIDREAEADRAKREAIARKESELRGVKIDGFFPTPAPLVSQLVEWAEIPEGAAVLEPSAGIGSIVEGITAAGIACDVEAIELRPSLCEILELKAIKTTRADFMELEPVARFDRVLMNPPFERGQDVEHVRRAFQWLKPGGRLVAIVSAGAFSNTDRKREEFRDWFNLYMKRRCNVQPGFFSGPDAFRNTSVNCVIIVVDKPRELVPCDVESEPQADTMAARRDELRARVVASQLATIETLQAGAMSDNLRSKLDSQAAVIAPEWSTWNDKASEPQAAAVDVDLSELDVFAFL